MVIPVVNKEECISCGNCVDLCPEVFNWDEDGKAEVIDPNGCGTKCPELRGGGRLVPDQRHHDRGKRRRDFEAAALE